MSYGAIGETTAYSAYGEDAAARAQRSVRRWQLAFGGIAVVAVGLIACIGTMSSSAAPAADAFAAGGGALPFATKRDDLRTSNAKCSGAKIDVDPATGEWAKGLGEDADKAEALTKYVLAKVVDEYRAIEACNVPGGGPVALPEGAVRPTRPPSVPVF